MRTYGSLYPGVGECRDGDCTPTFGECFSAGDFDTCAEACAACSSTTIACRGVSPCAYQNRSEFVTVEVTENGNIVTAIAKPQYLSISVPLINELETAQVLPLPDLKLVLLRLIPENIVPRPRTPR